MEETPIISKKRDWMKIAILLLLIVNLFELSKIQKINEQTLEASQDAANYAHRALNEATDASSYAYDAADASREGRDYAANCPGN